MHAKGMDPWTAKIVGPTNISTTSPELERMYEEENRRQRQLPVYMQDVWVVCASSPFG